MNIRTNYFELKPERISERILRKSMDNILQLGKPHHFSVEGEIAKRIHLLLMEYEGQISVVSAVGVLEVVKHELMANNGTNT